MEVQWLIPNRVLHSHAHGIMNHEKIMQLDKLLIAKLQEAQPNTVTILADMREVTRLEYEPVFVLKKLGYYRHPFFMGQVNYNMAPTVKAYMQALASLMRRISRRHYQHCETYEEAINFLLKQELIQQSDLQILTKQNI